MGSDLSKSKNKRNSFYLERYDAVWISNILFHFFNCVCLKVNDHAPKVKSFATWIVTDCPTLLCKTHSTPTATSHGHVLHNHHRRSLIDARCISIASICLCRAVVVVRVVYHLCYDVARNRQCAWLHHHHQLAYNMPKWRIIVPTDRIATTQAEAFTTRDVINARVTSLVESHALTLWVRLINHACSITSARRSCHPSWPWCPTNVSTRYARKSWWSKLTEASHQWCVYEAKARTDIWTSIRRASVLWKRAIVMRTTRV